MSRQLEFTVQCPGGGKLVAFHPMMTPEQLQRFCKRDDPAWSSNRKPRFRVLTRERAEAWKARGDVIQWRSA